jgi:DNA polymerase III delta prime subunit
VPKKPTELAPPAPLREIEPPKPFVGQEHVVDYFRRIGPDGLAHAYLLHGPRGVGKRSFAKTLALTLHCERPSSFPLGYCGKCGPCIRGIAGSSGDLIFVDSDFIHEADALAGKPERKTSDFGIEASRRIISLMEMKSYEGGRLVTIVPDFENVTGLEAYNALLKELEEPDPGKLFLLTAERAETIIDTIRSRTVAVRFNLLGDNTIADHLVRHYGKTKTQAEAIAKRSLGSLGYAIEELDEDSAALRNAAREWLLTCLRAPKTLPPIPQLDKDDRESARGQLGDVLRQARIAARDLMVSALGSAGLTFDREAAADYKKTLSALGENAGGRAALAIAAINEAERLNATNIAPGAILGWLQVQLRSLT